MSCKHPSLSQGRGQASGVVVRRAPWMHFFAGVVVSGAFAKPRPTNHEDVPRVFSVSGGKLQTVDRIASMLVYAFGVSNTASLTGVVGRTFVLKSAYRQLEVCETDRNLLRILVNDPQSSSIKCLGLNALPFRAVGSVTA